MTATIATPGSPWSQVQASREAAIGWVSVHGDEMAQPSRAERHPNTAVAAARPTPAALIQWVSVHGDELLAV
jgi:hypothetical protein